MPVIEVRGLTKTFRTYKKQPGFAGAIKGLFHRQYEQIAAVNNVSFNIETGELVGLLGPNGAGKTTTLRCWRVFFIPRVVRRGCWAMFPGNAMRLPPPIRARARSENQLWWDLPPRESLELNAKIYGIPNRSLRGVPSPK
jgi:ABC-2 type transport system ATP-binding protein